MADETSRTRRNFPFPYPNGWFQVAYSDELITGDVVRLSYFGEDLVAKESLPSLNLIVIVEIGLPHSKR